MTIYVEDIGDFDKIFTNEPSDMTATIPVWIRPGTVIYTVHSVFAELYDVQVQYRLESGEASCMK